MLQLPIWDPEDPQGWINHPRAKRPAKRQPVLGRVPKELSVTKCDGMTEPCHRKKKTMEMNFDSENKKTSEQKNDGLKKSLYMLIY